MSQSDLDYFLTIPWCASLLKDPEIIPVLKEGKSTSDQFFNEVLQGDDAVRSYISFYKRPSENSDIANPVQKLFVLVDIGPKVSGWPGVSHGGFISTLFDNVGGWLVQHNVGEGIRQKRLSKGSGMLTAKLEVTYLKPVRTNQIVLLMSTIEAVKGKKMSISMSLEDESRTTLCRGSMLAIIVDHSSRM